MKLHTLFRPVKNALTTRTSEDVFASLSNMKSVIRGYERRIRFKNGLIEVTTGSETLTICRRHRTGFYKRGIDRRIQRLASEYLLDQIMEPLEGTFIDCGANVGELGLYARKHGLRYVAFEPEKLEADCCDINNFGGKPETNRVGLWSHDTTLTFYSKPDSADSSLFEPGDAVAKSELKVRSLDNVAKELGIGQIAILKIEAEGAEPEVLMGASDTLQQTRYVAIDCGFERGTSMESTLVPAMNILIRKGFEALSWNPKRVTVLFRNRNLP